MTHPQPAIFALGTRDHLHLQFDAVGDPAALLDGVRQLRQEATTVAGVNVVVGFGPSAVTALSSDFVPRDFVATGPIGGLDGFTIPDTQHDLWVWLHGTGQDSLLAAAQRAVSALGSTASLVDEQPSFVYGASQDLTGFEDGTENPPVDDAVALAAVPEGVAGGGGSIVLVQQWVHDLDAFNRLEITEQEQVIGRTLTGSVELDDLPADSHVARVVVEDDQGDELEVFRRSTSFGGVDEHGLIFVAFSRDQARLRQMLDSMAGAEDGVRDRLTRFSTPKSSAWYFAPPVEAFA